MHYIFDVKDAEEYGLEEAVMLYNIRYWITLNKANGTNFNDGRTWTYNSVSAFKKLFPFWSERQIGRILKSLIDKHILITGNYNQIAYDRTLWYAFLDESILLNGEMEITEQENRIVKNVTPIPDINTDSKPNHKPNKNKQEKEDSFNIFWEIYNKKKNKEKSFQIWCKIDPELYQVIYNHVKIYRKTKEGKDFPYHPNNYLKDKHWNDEIETEETIEERKEKERIIREREMEERLTGAIR
jgi:hypothetical protein